MLRGRKPCWLVLPFRSDSGLAERILEDILLELGAGGTVDLVAPVTALGFRHRAGDLRNFAAKCGADFIVEGSLHHPADHLEIAVWLVDDRTGITKRSARIVKASPTDAVAAVVSWLLE